MTTAKKRTRAEITLARVKRYRKAGWQTFWLAPDSKKPTRGSRGFKDASRDPQVELPDLQGTILPNVGIRTGTNSGLFVLDVDVKNDGPASLEELVTTHGPLPETLRVQTPSGGEHYYFACTKACRCRTGLLPGLDIRADDGYVVAPPSRVGGKAYRWKRPRKAPLSDLIAEVPAWLLELARGPKNAPAAPYDAEVPVGDRHSFLLQQAVQLRRGQTPPDTLVHVLRTLRDDVCESGGRRVTDAELDGIVAWVSGKVNPAPPLTDVGNAERLTGLFGEEIRYCYERKRWLVWDGKRWREDPGDGMVQRAKAAVKTIYSEAANASDDDARKALSSWAKHSEHSQRIEAMIKMAKDRLPVRESELDTDPYLLNCENGTLDLREGTLLPHHRRNFITRLCPVAYDPEASTAEWRCFLRQSLSGDKKLIGFLKRALGYSLTGDISEEVLFLVHGPGATGKSTFIDAIKSSLGDYAKTADFETFLRRRDTGGPRPELVRLKGARFVASIEVESGRQMAEGVVKALTGGDEISARALYRDAIEFRFSGKIWLVANDVPKMRAEDSAMWRRVLRIPFEHIVPPKERDPTLKKRLMDPEIGGPAVLRWAVEGCRLWKNHRLRPPQAVRQATAALKQEMDPLGRFLSECCVLESDAWVSSKELRNAYNDWCRDEDEKAVSIPVFRQLVSAHECQNVRRRVHGERLWGWIGVRLRGRQS